MRDQWKGLSSSESGAMISAIGALVGFGIGVTQPLRDWIAGELVDGTHYVCLVVCLVAPVLAVFLFCAWRVRRASPSRPA